MNKLILLVCTVLMAGCTATTKEELTESGLKRSDFQTEVNGEKTDLFVLKNKNKMEVCVTNFGGCAGSFPIGKASQPGGIVVN